MGGGDLENNHPNFDGDSKNRLSAESLPLIDTRLLSQSELLALSHCSSSLSPSSTASLATSAGVDDDLTPIIDRSVFNESAGSRKQTFLRLRLARHPPPPPSPQRQQRDDSSREENLQIASLLRSLFSIDSNPRKTEEDEPEENEGQALIPIPIHDIGNAYLDSIKNVMIQGISGNEIGRRRGRPRKIRNPNDVVDSERAGPVTVDKTSRDLGTESRFDDTGISKDPNLGKRKRGRPRKSGDVLNKEEIVNFENREGTMVDLSALANYGDDDPYGEELRRMTLELKTMEELLGFLERVDGEWVNVGKKKKKKVVEACDYGGYLPKRWKLMLCLEKKGSNLWLACRKYVSPDGEEFETWKEVSTYLQSLVDSRSKNQLNALQSENKTLGEPEMMANESSLVGNSDSIDLPDLIAEMNESLESKRINSDVFEEVKGDIVEPVKSSLVEKDSTAESLSGDTKDNIMKKRDDNVENLAVPSNSQAQSEEFIQDLPWTSKEIQQIWGSRNP